MQTKFIITIACMIFVSVSIFVIMQNYSSNIANTRISDDYVRLDIPESLFIIELPKNTSITIDGTSKAKFVDMRYSLDPKLATTYDNIGVDSNAVVIYPTFTQTAYGEKGFYDFFYDICDTECLTVSIKDDFKGTFSTGKAGYNALKTLGYNTLTDVDVDKNPQILNNYDKVILLHNEYVTKDMFDAITHHPNVIYLYPNALYAEISVDYDQNTISLIRGHNYPDYEILNGFDWEFDNTPFEYDTQCIDWSFSKINNGVMLNCYPEYVMHRDAELLKYISEF